MSRAAITPGHAYSCTIRGKRAIVAVSSVAGRVAKGTNLVNDRAVNVDTRRLRREVGR